MLVFQENQQLENKYAIDRESSVCVFKIKVLIESAIVRGSNKDGRDVFLAVS